MSACCGWPRAMWNNALCQARWNRRLLQPAKPAARRSSHRNPERGSPRISKTWATACAAHISDGTSSHARRHTPSPTFSNCAGSPAHFENVGNGVCRPYIGRNELARTAAEPLGGVVRPGLLERKCEAAENKTEARHGLVPCPDRLPQRVEHRTLIAEHEMHGLMQFDGEQIVG